MDRATHSTRPAPSPFADSDELRNQGAADIPEQSTGETSKVPEQSGDDGALAPTIVLGRE